MSERIPFFLKLSASQEALEPFSSISALPSFLPMAASSDSIASFASIQHQLSLSARSVSRASSSSSSSTARHKAHPTVRVVLARHVSVDARSPGQVPRSLSRSQMHKSSVIGEGVLYSTKVGNDSITWAGEVRVAPRAGVRCVGFSTRNLTVRDVLIVSITQPNAKSSPLQEFRQVIPMQLTTDSFFDHERD